MVKGFWGLDLFTVIIVFGTPVFISGLLALWGFYYQPDRHDVATPDEVSESGGIK